MKKIFNFILEGISSFFNKKKKGDNPIDLSLMTKRSTIIINGNVNIVIKNNNNKN